MKAIDRILQYIEIKGIKPIAFERKVSLSNGYIGKQLKRNADLGETIFLKIIENCPDINPNWLLTGKGDMIKQSDSLVSEPQEVYRLKSDKNLKDQSIPLYNIEASAGIVTLFSDSTQNNPIDFIQVPGLPKCDGAVYVSGDSMYPLLKSGDIVMYKQVQNCIDEIYWGQMYLISIDQGGDEMVMVKYIQKSDKGETYIKLVSQNSHHQDKDLLLKKVRALALIKASIRINSMS